MWCNIFLSNFPDIFCILASRLSSEQIQPSSFHFSHPQQYAHMHSSLWLWLIFDLLYYAAQLTTHYCHMHHTTKNHNGKGRTGRNYSDRALSGKYSRHLYFSSMLASLTLHRHVLNLFMMVGFRRFKLWCDTTYIAQSFLLLHSALEDLVRLNENFSP